MGDEADPIPAIPHLGLSRLAVELQRAAADGSPCSVATRKRPAGNRISCAPAGRLAAGSKPEPNRRSSFGEVLTHAVPGMRVVGVDDLDGQGSSEQQPRDLGHGRHEPGPLSESPGFPLRSRPGRLGRCHHQVSHCAAHHPLIPLSRDRMVQRPQRSRVRSASGAPY